MLPGTYLFLATRLKKSQVGRVSHPLRRLPLVEQTARHLREGFQSGRWGGPLPGVVPLAEELMVSKEIVRKALNLLKGEGWIEDGGPGRRRRIVVKRIDNSLPRTLRIGIMLNKPLEKNATVTAKILLDIRHAIEIAGHTCIFSDRSMEQMGNKVPGIARAVMAMAADAWIVCLPTGTVLEWFAAQIFPVYVLGGRLAGFPVSGSATSIAPAVETALGALIKQGHRRIVMLAATVLRQPKPIPSLEHYLTCLEANGIVPAEYHLPHFADTAAGLENCLDSLFRLTPPTALLVGQADYCVAVFAFLARNGLQVPRDVSVVFTHTDPIFALRHPPLDHFHVPVKNYISTVTRWVDGVARNRPVNRQVILPAVYVPGGTVGPAKK